MAETPIQIHMHPPERRQRGGVVLYGTCCCSCCCCCLHVVGSVLGAISAAATTNQARPRGTPPAEALEKFRPSSQAPASDSVTERPNEAIAPPDFGLTEAKPPAPTPPSALPPLPDLSDLTDWSLSAASLYWLTVLALTSLACLWAAFYSRSPAEDIMLLIFGLLPVVQLAASLLSALLVFLWPAEEWLPRWRTIGRMALWAFLGTIVGLMAMSPCLLPIFRW